MIVFPLVGVRFDLSKPSDTLLEEPFMALDPELLEILVCPKSHGELELVPLPPVVCNRLVERYREHFRNEEPEVEHGLLCTDSQLVYPVVSDIPIMLEDEALSATVLQSTEPS